MWVFREVVQQAAIRAAGLCVGVHAQSCRVGVSVQPCRMLGSVTETKSEEIPRRGDGEQVERSEDESSGHWIGGGGCLSAALVSLSLCGPTIWREGGMTR